MKRIKTKMKALLLLTIIAFTLNSCYKITNCIPGNGIPVIEERGLSTFDMISSNGAYEVYVYPSNSYYVVVDAESNLIDFISTRVRGKSLVIESRNNRCLNNTIPIIVNVYTPYVEGFTLNGSGLIQAYGLSVDEMRLSLNGSGMIDIDLDTDFLQAHIAGSGTIEVSGVAPTTELSISGSGTILAYQLSQSWCYASITGSGSMYVHPNRLLDATITGSGSIFYRGNPEVISTITGSGRIIKQ